MGHTDVVNVDPKKWTHPPFGAVRDGGYIYGRGTVDDKDNVTAALMVMLLLKRANVPLDRDVIFLAESGEEGTTRVGIEFMANQHFAAIDAEFCYAEGGGVTRQAGQVRYASVQTVEKIPRGIDLIARGIVRPRLGAADHERDRAPGRRRRPRRRRGGRPSRSTTPRPRTSSGSRRCRRPTWRSTTATC